MKRVPALVVAVALCALCAVAFVPRPVPGQGRSQAPKGKFRKVERAITDQYIVVLKDDLPDGDVDSVADNLASLHRGFKRHVYRHALKGFSVQLPEAAAMALSRHPLVEYVEEDAEVSIPDPPPVSPSGLLDGTYQPPTGGTYYDPNAPGTQYNAPFGLDRIDQRGFPLTGTYTYTNTGAGVNVYVIDSGIRTTHQDFGGRAFVAADFIGDGQNGQDCMGHGTHVAGIIGGSSYGVAKGVKLFALRVFGCSGLADGADVIAAVDWVTANHIKPAVANMRLGVRIADGSVQNTIDLAVGRSIAAGVTYVIAAGNDGINAYNFSPAHVTAAITVGASSSSAYLGTDGVASFSNYGSVLDVFAPGVYVPSAWFTTDTATSYESGTSMATPHVAGVAARYLQRNPGASPKTVSLAITSNATTGKLGTISSPDRLLYSAFDMAWQPPPPTCKPGDKEACLDFGGTWNSSTCTCSSICFQRPWLCE